MPRPVRAVRLKKQAAVEAMQLDCDEEAAKQPTVKRSRPESDGEEYVPDNAGVSAHMSDADNHVDEDDDSDSGRRPIAVFDESRYASLESRSASPEAAEGMRDNENSVPTVIPAQSSRNSKVKQPKTKKIKTSNLMTTSSKRAPKTKRVVDRKKHYQGSREDTFISLLGAHADVEHAMSQRKLWAPELIGPNLSLISTRVPGDSKCHELQVSLAEERLHEASTPVNAREGSSSNLKVQFVNPITLGVLERVMSAGDVHDCAPSGSMHGSFTICTGIRNTSVDWLRGRVQYIAVGGTSLNAEPSPLFSFNPDLGTIQIWEILSRGVRACNLRIVYTHEFGTSWQVRWCPHESKDEGVLGWLAGCFGNGTVNVWRVKKSLGTDSTEFRVLEHPSFTLRIPESNIVSFDWLSEVRIAVGCANGMFAVWDLASDGITPFVVGHQHETYINNIVSCAPSAPEVVLTTAWDCDVKFSNIRRPETDVVSALRERMPVYAAAWSEFLNCAIVNEDLHNVRLVSLRAGYSASLANMAGTVTALATDPDHPFLAMADTSGAMTILNLCRKALCKKQDQYQRKIFQLDMATQDKTFRFTENFEISELLGKKDATISVVTNIYPREICVNSVAWNHNPGYQELLASCTDRFVRVDDLSRES